MKQKIHASFSVGYEHQVHFTRDVFRPDNPLLANTLASRSSNRVPRVLFVLDENVVKVNKSLRASIQEYFTGQNRRFELISEFVQLPAGEAAKNDWNATKKIYQAIERHGLCRHCYVVAIGGGALLDVAGFAAATAHRGIRHLRLPTTVLGQSDAGVGVKNGVNLFGKKNFVGTFAPPFAVINDLEFLATLPDREKRAGYIEAVKVALIRDREFFESLEYHQERLKSFDPRAIEDLSRRCAEAHVRHIATSGDPFELGSARPLDFGHWAAHKLEQLSDFRIHHGEAVAIGIAIDVIYSQLAKYLPTEAAERILLLLESLGFQLWADELLTKNKDGKLVVLEGLEEFREHLGGNLTITLLKTIGRGFEAHEMDEAKVKEAIGLLHQRTHQS